MNRRAFLAAGAAVAVAPLALAAIRNNATAFDGPRVLCHRDIGDSPVGLDVEITRFGEPISNAIAYDLDAQWVDVISLPHSQAAGTWVPVRLHGGVDVQWSARAEQTRREYLAGHWPTWHERNARRA